MDDDKVRAAMNDVVRAGFHLDDNEALCPHCPSIMQWYDGDKNVFIGGEWIENLIGWYCHQCGFAG